MKFFEREVEVYMWLVPRMQKLRKEKGLKPLKFPKCVYGSMETEMLIMENLKVAGFQLAGKTAEGL